MTGPAGGEELLETIDRADPELVLVGHSFRAGMAPQAGFDGYITRPIDVRAFPSW